MRKKDEDEDKGGKREEDEEEEESVVPSTGNIPRLCCLCRRLSCSEDYYRRVAGLGEAQETSVVPICTYM